jgi:hypothetical protein
MNPQFPAGSEFSSNENFTSLEVIGVPSENFTPLRSLNVHVNPSLDALHDVARLGFKLLASRAGSKRVSKISSTTQMPALSGGMLGVKLDSRSPRKIVRFPPLTGVAADATCENENDAGSTSETATVATSSFLESIFIQILPLLSRTSRRIP